MAYPKKTPGFEWDQNASLSWVSILVQSNNQCEPQKECWVPLTFPQNEAPTEIRFQGGPGCCVPYTNVVQHNSNKNDEALPVQGLL